MKTKLEAGKEYWLGESKKFKGIYKGSLGKAHYFYITYGDDNFTHDANGFVEFPLHGVFEIEQWQFTTPIAMKCTEEQFNGIEDKLFDMGYKLSISCDPIDGIWLVNNFGGVSNCFGLACGTPFQKTKFNSFNPYLFLALAAMTDKEDGIKGEWWVHPLDFKLCTFESYDIGPHAPIFRKATAQEIIEHFEKKEFVLPDRWCVKVGGLNTNEIILKWRHENSKYKYYSGSKGYINYDGFFTKEPLYAEITFDQFKKYVLKGTTQSCQKTPVVGSIEYTVNVEFDAEKAAKELFAKIVEFGKSSQPEYKFTTESWHINDKKEIVLEDKTIISIPPTKQATLFDDRVEITDWKPKDNDEVLVVSINVDGWGFTKTKYKFVAEPYKAHGFIKRTESEAKQLVEKLKQAML